MIINKVDMNNQSYLELSASHLRTFLAVVNNLLDDLSIPDEHRQTAVDIQTECHAVVQYIDNFENQKEENHERTEK